MNGLRCRLWLVWPSVVDLKETMHSVGPGSPLLPREGALLRVTLGHVQSSPRSIFSTLFARGHERDAAFGYHNCSNLFIVRVVNNRHLYKDAIGSHGKDLNATLSAAESRCSIELTRFCYAKFMNTDLGWFVVSECVDFGASGTVLFISRVLQSL